MCKDSGRFQHKIPLFRGDSKKMDTLLTRDSMSLSFRVSPGTFFTVLILIVTKNYYFINVLMWFVYPPRK